MCLMHAHTRRMYARTQTCTTADGHFLGLSELTSGPLAQIIVNILGYLINEFRFTWHIEWPLALSKQK